jgi:hypothetical protein
MTGKAGGQSRWVGRNSAKDVVGAAGWRAVF